MSVTLKDMIFLSMFSLINLLLFSVLRDNRKVRRESIFENTDDPFDAQIPIINSWYNIK